MKIYGSVEVAREIELSTAYRKEKDKKLKKKCNKITTARYKLWTQVLYDIQWGT
jgi:hypothetical protein